MMPTKWGQGQIFAFSAIDGDSFFGDDFAGTLAGDKIGVIFHTIALWIDDEKRIRQVSLLGSPFWFVYNFVSGAYGSCIGDILSIVSLITAKLRFDFKNKKTN